MERVVDSAMPFVPETRFGFWFLGTEIWTNHVLAVAIHDLERLIPQRQPAYPVILDIGCGQGKSFRLLHHIFSPQCLIGVDVDAASLQQARRQATQDNLQVELLQNDGAALELPDACVSLVFCHQTFHHMIRQEETLSELYRVLQPGGLLLFAESTRAYISSWIIRLLFRHPMEVQRSAAEYLAMLHHQGFTFGPENISFPYLWWSRPDFGMVEWLGFPLPQKREETLLNVVARKPCSV
ncbi:MAG: class I SAM-dependent methyltransferase [Candidatus Tectimicrobiota bacterium]